MKKLLLLAAVALAILAVPQKTIAAIPWTTACSAGATLRRVDLANYSVIDNYLRFEPGSIGTLVARYDVTDVAGKRFPGWTMLELGSLDIDPLSNVTATLFEWNCDEDVLTPICTVTSPDIPGVQCTDCQFGANVIDFGGKNIFFVEVTVTRTAITQDVRAESLRIF